MAGTLITLKSKFEAVVATIEPIKKFQFDDVSVLNGDSQADFPLFLIKVPSPMFPKAGDATNPGAQFEYQIYDIMAAVFMPEMSDDYHHWTELVDNCQDLLRKVLMGVAADRQNFVIIGNIPFTFGHYAHNQKLAYASSQFKLRMYYGC